MSPRREREPRFWPFLLLALLVHYVQFTLIPSLSLWKPVEVPRDSVDLEFVETQLEEKSEERRQEELKKERTPDGQVVELPKPVEEHQPEKARFVSEYDTRVEKETRARGARNDAQTAPPATSTAPSLLAMRERPQPTEARSPVPVTEEDVESPQSSPEPEASGAPEAPRKTPTLGQLRPSDEQVTRALGGGSADFLPEVEDGEDTALNSKRWRFASFFNRVKRQVAENWHPEIAYRRRDPYGNVYGFRDRMTVLRVSLWPDGNLKDLLVEHPSGVAFLDDEALQAFRAAQPFLNPPRQLMDPDSGLISFRFGFIFEINSSPSFRVFRYSD